PYRPAERGTTALRTAGCGIRREDRMASFAADVDVTTVPKVELPVHLNGDISKATASDLARRHGVDPAAALRLVDGQDPPTDANFERVLDTDLATNQFVRTPDDLELVAADHPGGAPRRRDPRLRTVRGRGDAAPRGIGRRADRRPGSHRRRGHGAGRGVRRV